LARTQTSLNGSWRYAPDTPQFAFGEHLGWTDPNFDDAAWPEMEIPACWDLADRALHGFEGYIWLRRTFSVNMPEIRGTFLCFDAVNYRADVWLNGHFLGAHEGGFTPFRFCIDEVLDAEGANSLVVKVDNRSLPERIPGTRLSWFNYGGVYRDVFVEQQPLARIADVTIDSRPSRDGRSGSATVDVAVTLRNDGETSVAGQLHLSLDEAASSVDVQIEPGAKIAIASTLRLAEVEYWSPDQPTLYTLGMGLTVADNVVDSRHMNVGIRRLVTNGTRLLLNGGHIHIKGFNRHEDYPTTGRAHDEEILMSDLHAIKACGANFVRASHYPQHSRFYEACDELGLMVMDEIPLWGWGRDATALEEPLPVEAAIQQLEEMVRHNRTRTCVVIWSVSNETGGGHPLIDHTNIELMQRVRQLDPTRLVTHVTLYSVWRELGDEAMAEDDLLCLNEYEGSLNPNPPVRSTADLPAAMSTLGKHLDALHQRFSDKPVVITEFGGIGLPGHHSTMPWSEEGYAATIRAHWQTFAERTWIGGALLWCWQDYPMHPNRVRSYPIGHYGIVTEDRVPKRACLEMVTELFRSHHVTSTVRP
jgi:beta-glucuronidase